MVAPLIIGAARLAAAALAKQAAKKTGQEIAKKTAVEAAKKEVRPSVAKFEKKYKYEPGEYVEAVKKRGIPTTKGELAKANQASRNPMLRKKEGSLPDSETNARAERSPEDYTPKASTKEAQASANKANKRVEDAYNRSKTKQDIKSAQRVKQKESSSGYDGVRFDDSEYPF